MEKAGQGRAEGEGLAASVSIGKGTDPGYYTEQASRGTDYYSAGAGYDKPGTEPPGTWEGDGLPDLGLARGGVVDHDAFKVIYGAHVDPRDGSAIGRRMSHRDAEEVYGDLLNAEPDATAERKAELYAQAQAKAERSKSVAFFDATFSVSKSITLLHASARAMRLSAQDSGDTDKEAQARALEDTIWNAISAGAQATLEHLQAHAGYTRLGPGGIHQEDAHGWVVSHWRQHTSRRGDPQLHIHQVILNKVRTERDGGWRTLDGQALYRERAAAAGIGAIVTENMLTRDLGIAWTDRQDGHGREIRGMPQALMDEFSARSRQDIAPGLAKRVDAYRQKYRHDPDELALWKMGQEVSRETRLSKTDADPAQQVREWAERARLSAGVALEPLAAQVCGQAQARTQDLSAAQESEVLARALNSIQGKRSTFTESDLTRAILEQLPADLAVDPELAAGFLTGLAARTISEGLAVSLDAPELFTIPDGLRRANGESVYESHRATRYSTDAQLQREARILALAEAQGAPCAEPDAVAALLGAGREALEAQLAPRAPADVTTGTGSGLHLDQAAAAFAVLTSDRAADVLVGPAGTGKSHVISAVSRIWPQLHPGGRVIALTETQQGANVLKGMGVADSHNISMFLTDPRLRDIPSGSVMLIDEASMVTMGHLDQLLTIARKAGAKLMLAGDHAQHQAVQAGGGLAMLVRRIGSFQLGEALRFSAAWERSASLRLRAADPAVIPEYDEQGRVMGGSREAMTEELYRRWLADYLDGRESVMIAREQADAYELSRRARADLIRYGRVAEGREAAIRDGAVASAGDLIMARSNDHGVSAGADGRQLANRDIYSLDRVLDDGSAVVRLQLRHGEFGEPVTLDAAYLAKECHLAYGRTSHDVQGSTFADRGYALIRRRDDREYAYTALSRGAGGNFAFCDTSEQAEVTGTPVAAPEVKRARTLAAEQDGTSPGPELMPQSGAGVLLEVLSRSTATLAATETLARSYSEADSLAVLSRIWSDLSGGEYSRRYDAAVRDLLPTENARKVTGDYRYTWLCRTLRAGELAGMDGRRVLAEAIGSGSLDGADNLCAVIDSRCRQVIPATVPMAGGWEARAPAMPEPGTEALIRDVGKAMDERTARLGEHTADTLPVWAEQNLGQVPDDPIERAAWCERAGAVAAYREMSGHASPGDPIGAAPNASDPERRAAWHTALMALAATDGIDLSGLSDRQLDLRRAQYERETASAPWHTGRELRLSRQARDMAAERHSRKLREAEIAKDPEVRARHEQTAAQWAGLHRRASAAADAYEQAMATRRDWTTVAEPTLRIGKAADLEKRRREPWARLEPMRSREPSVPVVEGDTVSDTDILRALGLTLDATETSDHPHRAAAQARKAQERLDLVASMPEAHEDTDMEPGEAGWRQAERAREAVSQPAQPMVPASARLDREAAED